MPRLPRHRGTAGRAVGVDWWAPLYEDLRGQDAYVERIQAMKAAGTGVRAIGRELGVASSTVSRYAGAR